MLAEPTAPAAADAASSRNRKAQLLQRALMQLPEDKREILI
jgi:DNA-directed RNA polymerase specialized sigma24 family protein